MSWGWSSRRGDVRVGDVPAVLVRCEDCGHTKRMAAPKSHAEYAVGALRERMVCSACQAIGAHGRNLDVVPVLRIAS